MLVRLQSSMAYSYGQKSPTRPIAVAGLSIRKSMQIVTVPIRV